MILLLYVSSGHNYFYRHDNISVCRSKNRFATFQLIQAPSLSWNLVYYIRSILRCNQSARSTAPSHYRPEIMWWHGSWFGSTTSRPFETCFVYRCQEGEDRIADRRPMPAYYAESVYAVRQSHETVIPARFADSRPTNEN